MLKTASSVLNAIGALNYQGTWNASTNVPTLTSSVGTKGDYYVVATAGTTNLNGITDWQIGDWAVFNGSTWQKVDNSDAIVSVNGQTGVVVLNAANVGATANTTYVLAGTGLSGGGQLNANVTVNLANTAVGAGTYGKTDSVGQFTVDAQGRITSASNVGISIPIANVTGGVANTVYVIAGTGLSGGGALTGNVTLNLANTAVTANTYGSASVIPVITVDAQGRLTSASNTSVAIGVAAVSGAVPNTVNVLAGTGLTGGGALTGNVTLSVSANTTQQLVAVQNNGVAVGTRQVHNFIPGTNIAITTADDAANGRANVTIATSGLGTIATQNANNVSITGGNIDGTAIGATTTTTAKFTTVSTSSTITIRSSTFAYNGIIAGASNTSSGYFATYNNSGVRIGLNGWYDGATYYAGYTDSTDPIGIYTNGTARIYVKGDGNVGVATTSSAYTFDVNGTIHYTTLTASSDRRFKTNVNPITNALDRLDKINPVRFEWNKFVNDRRNGYELNKPTFGVMAQDVQAVFPELVTTWKLSDDCSDALSVNYEKLIPILIAAIKELKAQLDAIKPGHP